LIFFSDLILGRNSLVKTDHWRGLILSLQNTKSISRPGSDRIRWGSLQRFPEPLTGFEGRGWCGGGARMVREGKRKRGKKYKVWGGDGKARRGA